MVGCNENTSHNKTEKPDITGLPDKSQVPLNTDGQLPEYFEPAFLLSIYQPAYNSNEKYFNLMDWQEYIKDKFDIEINVFYNSKELGGVQAVYYYNYLPGYPYTKVDQVFNYISSEIAYDLSLYYEKYGWYNFIDPLYIESLKVDGCIYAVPTAPNKYIIPRYYNAGYLDRLGMEVPKDINSFYEYLIGAKKIMEGQGILLPMFIPQHRMFPCTSDIFRAFGVYVNSEQNSALAFNPNTQSFEDAIFSEDIETALDFFRTLQSDGLMGFWGEAHSFNTDNINDINKNQFIGDRFNVNKNFATEYNLVYDTDANFWLKFLLATPGYETTSGYYLEYINTKNICEVRSDVGFYVFPKNIENINGTIDLFNSIMTDRAYYADLLYGMENTDYEIINNETYSKLPDQGTFPGIRMLKTIEDPNNYYSPGNIDIAGEIASGLMYESNIFNQTTRYRDIVGNFIISQSSYFDNLFLTCVSTSDAVAEYKKWFLESGWYQNLEKLNERINAVTVYDYTP